MCLDELVLPLLLETIPTKKEFAERTNSLSPEQQAFSKAYRELQVSERKDGKEKERKREREKEKENRK